MTKPLEIPEAIFLLTTSLSVALSSSPSTVPSRVESDSLTEGLRNAPSPALSGLLCGQR